MKDKQPNPGSREAVELGCRCPIFDNAHGRGYMGGVKDKDGETMFVFNENCPLHGAASPAKQEAAE